VPNIRIFFGHKVQSIDFDQRTMLVHDSDEGKDIRVAFDFCIGADGSYSVVRRQLMRVIRCAFVL
jgi:kynurenine 3-monooxygenase